MFKLIKFLLFGSAVAALFNWLRNGIARRKERNFEQSV